MVVTAGRLEEDKAQLVEQPADIQVVSTTTLVNTDLVVPVAAGAYCLFRVRAIFGAGTTGDARFAWSVPSGTVMSRRILGTNAAFPGDDAQMIFRARAAGTEETVGGGITFTNYWEDVQVNVGSVAGTCTLMYAQGTSNATATIVRAQSYVEYIRIR